MQARPNATFVSNVDLTFIYTDGSAHGITFVNVEAGRRLISYRLNRAKRRLSLANYFFLC